MALSRLPKGARGSARAPSWAAGEKIMIHAQRDAEDASSEEQHQSVLAATTHWLRRHTAELPEAIEGYVSRPGLEARCVLTARRLTVLHAPGGFGKTALLAQCCRQLRERGVAIAWLSLDEEYRPASFATYVTLAFERAGVKSVGEAGSEGEEREGREPDPEADSHADYRIGLLVRALERHKTPCVLVLDEVERLRSREAVAVLNGLLLRAPDNLHVGIAYRERPPGLEVAVLALEGRATTVTVDDLRFSPEDASRFFRPRLPRRELRHVLQNSVGWPIALRIYRNADEEGIAPTASGGGGDLVSGWVETRLWRGVSEEDRNFVLDISLFNSIELDLVQEAAGALNPGRRLAAIGALAGLLCTRGDGSALQLHPMIKDYCEKRRFEESPERFRSLHRAIADALRRRQRTREALRHAHEAGDSELLGQLAESTGGVRLWLKEGVEAARSVDRLLTEGVLWQFPRLALLRCVVLTVAGDIDAAKHVYVAASAQTDNFLRDRAGGNNTALQIDHLVALGVVELCGCRPFSKSITTSLARVNEVVAQGSSDPVLRGSFRLGLCMLHNQRTAFDTAVEWAERARADFDPSSPYIAHVDFQLGSAAMARGHTSEAKRCYERGMKVGRASHPRDMGASILGQVLASELELERSAGTVPETMAVPSPKLLSEHGAWLDIYAASTEIRVEHALTHSGPQRALAVVDQALAHARRTDRRP